MLTLTSDGRLSARVAAGWRQLGADTRAIPDIKREDDLKQFIAQTFSARLPDKACCAGHAAPWRVFCDAYFARHSMIVIKGSRGLAGKTWFLALLGLAEAITLRADVAILGGSGGQSERVHKAMERFWGSPVAPHEMISGEPGITKTSFKAGNEIRALTASQKSVRGPHPQRLRLDEVDEMDIRIFNAAMGQTLAARGIPAQTVIASTHQNADGTFTEVLKRAAEKGWWVREWCYRETLEPHGWLALDEVQRKRSEMTEAMWNVEVELQEPSPEGRAIRPEAVERMFTRALGETDGRAGEDEQFEEPVDNATYATGADWGKTKDYTAICTLRTDVMPRRLVAFYRNRKTAYHLMTPKLDERVRAYPGGAAHDASGVGVRIREDIACNAEHYTQWRGRPRIGLFSDYITAIERGEVVAPRSLPWYRAHKYVTNNDLYGNGHPPDEFIACALAYRAARLGQHGLLYMNEPGAEEMEDERDRLRKELGLE